MINRLLIVLAATEEEAEEDDEDDITAKTMQIAVNKATYMISSMRRRNTCLNVKFF